MELVDEVRLAGPAVGVGDQPAQRLQGGVWGERQRQVVEPAPSAGQLDGRRGHVPYCCHFYTLGNID